MSLLQFVYTLEANILKTLNAVCNVSITSVVASSISVTNLYAFTGSDSAAAAAAQASLANVLKSGSVSSLFGSGFGTVTVSGVATSNATNPGKKYGPAYLSCGLTSELTSTVYLIFDVSLQPQTVGLGPTS